MLLCSQNVATGLERELGGRDFAATPQGFALQLEVSIHDMLGKPIEFGHFSVDERSHVVRHFETSGTNLNVHQSSRTFA
jgi:hypothetical protein